MEVTTIYYDYNKNLFYDEFGQIEYDITDIMPFEQVMIYKKVGGTYYTKINGEVFEIEFPISISNDRALYYYAKDNTMCDDDGDIIYNIFSIITPNDLMLFKKGKETVWIKDIDGDNIELVYSDEYYE